MFKEQFKYYKSKKPAPDLTGVIDMSENLNNSSKSVSNLSEKDLKLGSSLGLTLVTQWKVFTIESADGLIFIKNPFTSNGQRYWIKRCLSEYTKKPQKLNIDPHNYISKSDDWWSLCCTQNDTSKHSLLRKLRWATLGYHHDWDTKIYSESSKDVFPTDLALLSKYVASLIGFEDFEPEAAIVNFYHMDSTLSGHTDHSEDNLEAPLLSFSFGQSAIFLIGGLTEECPATPIFIHSGDIIIMSKRSRLCYHAVPRIVRTSLQPWNELDHSFNSETNQSDISNDYKNDVYWKPFDDYVQNSRINMNVRQVLQKGQNKLNR